MSLAGLATSAGIELWLMRIVFPEARYGATPVIQFVHNLIELRGYIPFLLFTAPFFWTLHHAYKNRSALTLNTHAMLLSATAFLAIWSVVGVLGEVRIFLPYALALAPLTATLFMQEGRSLVRTHRVLNSLTLERSLLRIRERILRLERSHRHTLPGLRTVLALRRGLFLRRLQLLRRATQAADLHLARLRNEITHTRILSRQPKPALSHLPEDIEAQHRNHAEPDHQPRPAVLKEIRLFLMNLMAHTMSRIVMNQTTHA